MWVGKTMRPPNENNMFLMSAMGEAKRPHPTPLQKKGKTQTCSVLFKSGVNARDWFAI